MGENRSSISKAQSYAEIGEYWDTHDLPADSEEVSFTVELDSNGHYYALDNSIVASLRKVAKKRGVSAEPL